MGGTRGGAEISLGAAASMAPHGTAPDHTNNTTTIYMVLLLVVIDAVRAHNIIQCSALESSKSFCYCGIIVCINHCRPTEYYAYICR